MPVLGVTRAETDDEVVASGHGLLFDESAAYSIHTRVYAEDAGVSRADLEGRLDEGLAGAPDATRVDIRMDDPVVTTALKFDHGTYRDLFGPLFAYPLVAWGFDYDSETLTITHRAGTDLDPSRYTLRDIRRREPTDEQFDDRYETVEPRDTLTVDLGGRTDWHLRLEGALPGDSTHQEFNVGDAQFDGRDATGGRPGPDATGDDD